MFWFLDALTVRQLAALVVWVVAGACVARDYDQRGIFLALLAIALGE